MFLISEIMEGSEKGIPESPNGDHPLLPTLKAGDHELTIPTAWTTLEDGMIWIILH